MKVRKLATFIKIVFRQIGYYFVFNYEEIIDYIIELFDNF